MCKEYCLTSVVRARQVLPEKDRMTLLVALASCTHAEKRHSGVWSNPLAFKISLRLTSRPIPNSASSSVRYVSMRRWLQLANV